jgi:ribonucleoside-diphosphate reductase alpha chain
VSKGLTRSRTDRLQVVPQNVATATVTAIGGTAARGDVAGAVALKAEPEAKLSPAEKLETLQWQQPAASPSPKAMAAEKRAEAKAKGYEGDPCGECQNYTLVRNGTCMKCDTCGSTTGCS